MNSNRQTTKCHFPRRIVLLCTWLLLFATPQINADTLIVLSGESSTYRAVADQIAANINGPSRILSLETITAQPIQGKYNEVVAVGSKASSHLFDTLPPQQKLYLSFLPRQTYESLIEDKNSHPRIKKKTVTAVFLDQPYNRQLALARLVSPEASKIATAFGPNSQKDLELLQQAATDNQFDLLHETLEESDNPIHKLQPLIKQSDVFLSLPDKSVFNRTTAKWILYISLRQRTPLIGFSRKYVEAGALAAVFSTPEQIGKQTAELIEANRLTKRLPAPSHPKYFEVSTNETVARTLKIKLPTAEVLIKKLQEKEQ